MPVLDQDVTHPLVEATGIATLEAVVERPVVEPTVSAGHETTTDTPLHLQDQDLNIFAQYVISAFVSFS